MRILNIVQGSLGINGISQIAFNMAECFAEAGHESWLYMNGGGKVYSMYEKKIKKINVLNKGKLFKKFFGITNTFDKTKTFDLVIHNVPRKSWSTVPRFKGVNIFFVYTPVSGFQSCNIYADRVFFPSHYMLEHFIRGMGSHQTLSELDPRHNDEDRPEVIESWKSIIKDFDENKWNYQYPPLNNNSFKRFVRRRVKRIRQLTLPRKIHSDWADFFENKINSVIDFKMVSGGIKTYKDRCEFWEQSDIALWAGKYDEGFGLNLHEAIFSGCIPVVLDRKDGSTELMKKHRCGYNFTTKDELIYIIDKLKNKDDLVQEQSRRSLIATKELEYENWYYDFLKKIDDLI